MYDPLEANLSRITKTSIEELRGACELIRRYHAGDTLTHEECQRYLRLHDPPPCRGR